MSTGNLDPEVESASRLCIDLMQRAHPMVGLVKSELEVVQVMEKLGDGGAAAEVGSSDELIRRAGDVEERGCAAGGPVEASPRLTGSWVDRAGPLQC